MEEKETKQKQTRRKYSADGERGQKMICFRLDNDLNEWLQRQLNKGRYINNLIRAHMDNVTQKRESNEVN